jgi:hypothetical protein
MWFDLHHWGMFWVPWENLVDVDLTKLLIGCEWETIKKLEYSRNDEREPIVEPGMIVNYPDGSTGTILSVTSSKKQKAKGKRRKLARGAMHKLMRSKK